MHSHGIKCVMLLALAVVGVERALAAEAKPTDEPKQSSPDDPKQSSSAGTPEPKNAQATIEQALVFLVKDAQKWRSDHGCATCHHGTMTVWALNEAQSRGYKVDTKALWDLTQWAKDQFMPRIRKPRDSRPGWNLVSVPAIYLGLMSQTLPVLSRDEMHQVASHLARHQEADGVWIAPPPKNGAPPTWESSETLALLAYLAWEPYEPADAKEAAAAHASRAKAADWLSKTKPTETTQSRALRLLLDVREGKPAAHFQSKIDQILSSQNPDGGWSQIAEMPSDAYATGQTLWVLSFAGVDRDRAEIQRAISFLLAHQREDGSWPMTSRNHPEVKSTRNPIRNPVPITYFGTVWATLGLLRYVPPTLDLAARQQQAFDAIRRFAGTYETDDKSPGKPVVSVKIVYELDNEDLASLVELLKAFPQLATLRFKSSGLSDAGLVHLKQLPQLRTLSLENAAITDAGLTQLKALTALEELNLAGTKVTAAGVQEFEKALPKVKVK
jgi:hypothetical protein